MLNILSKWFLKASHAYKLDWLEWIMEMRPIFNILFFHDPLTSYSIEINIAPSHVFEFFGIVYIRNAIPEHSCNPEILELIHCVFVSPKSIVYKYHMQ